MGGRRAKQDGWIRIGAVDTTGRRSLWVRFDPQDEPVTDAQSIELCAGREGDDAHVRVFNSNHVFGALLDVLITAQFASET